MPLVTTKELLLKAQKEKYAIGAFNVENLEMAQAVIEAAEEMKSPIIVQTTSSTVKYASADIYFNMIKAIAKNVSVPVVVHLDHGASYELCVEAMNAGYTSVMIDGSQLDFESNVAVTKKTVQAATKAGIYVEAELGTVGGKEDDHEVKNKDALYTNAKQAKEFVERTGASSLAVAIGTAHGHYKGEPVLDFDRLQEIRENVDVPLVMHGTSGVKDEDVKRCIEIGMCKINYATDLRDAYTRGVRKILEADSTVFDPKAYGREGREQVKKSVKEKIIVCGSQNKAN